MTDDRIWEETTGLPFTPAAQVRGTGGSIYLMRSRPRGAYLPGPGQKSPAEDEAYHFFIVQNGGESGGVSVTEAQVEELFRTYLRIRASVDGEYSSG